VTDRLLACFCARSKDRGLKVLGIVGVLCIQLRTPFHEFCLRSDVLCRSCQEKLEKGEFSKLDLEISKVLMASEEGKASTEGIEFLKSYAARGMLLIKLRKGSMVHLSAQLNDLQDKIRRATRRKPVFFEEGESIRAVSERLLYPTRILSSRTSWLPGGANLTVMKVSGKPDVDLKEAAKLLSDLYGVELNITSNLPS
jgi:hypothetical protein